MAGCIYCTAIIHRALVREVMQDFFHQQYNWITARPGMPGAARQGSCRLAAGRLQQILGSRCDLLSCLEVDGHIKMYVYTHKSLQKYRRYVSYFSILHTICPLGLVEVRWSGLFQELGEAGLSGPWLWLSEESRELKRSTSKSGGRECRWLGLL